MDEKKEMVPILIVSINIVSSELSEGQGDWIKLERSGIGRAEVELDMVCLLIWAVFYRVFHNLDAVDAC